MAFLDAIFGPRILSDRLNCDLEHFSATDYTFIHPCCVCRAIQGQPWAPNSPDLTPCDYWLHGHMKVTNNVFLLKLLYCFAGSHLPRTSTNPAAPWESCRGFLWSPQQPPPRPDQEGCPPHEEKGQGLPGEAGWDLWGKEDLNCFVILA